MPIETFYKDKTKTLCTVAYKCCNTLRHMEKKIIDFFRIQTALNIIKITHFCHVQNMQNTEYGKNDIHNLSTGPQKNNRIFND